MGVNFNSLDFNNISGKSDRQIIDHLFMLKEQLEYTLSNLDSSNFNYRFFDELTVRVQNGLNIEGVVTFEALATNEETVINGAYIKTGTVEASNFVTYTVAETTGTYGEVKMFYKEYGWWLDDDALLAGGIRMDDEGLGTDESSRFRLWIYTSKLEDSAFRVSLKLSSAYRASLEAQGQIYIYCSMDPEDGPGSVTIGAERTNSPNSISTVNILAGMLNINGGTYNAEQETCVVRINGSLYVNGEKIA